MNKYLLCAAFTGALATVALAQSTTTGSGNNPTAAAPAQSNQAPMAAPDQRAKDLQSTMEIRKWQTGPSLGDQSANMNSAPGALPSAEQRAAGLQSQMEIRSWQTGPSSGDQTARIGAGNSQPTAPTAPLDTSSVPKELEKQSSQ
jgi:hypothetical protein